jgi:NAD(P)-dependent dehydrogenase (short-subunit alcohol dehydrogenase family)
MPPLDDGVTVITGAASGIGRECARAFAGAGSAVAIADLNEDDLKAVAAAIEADGGRAVAIPCDVRREDQVEALFARTVAELGEVTALVPCAGIVSFEQTAECTLDDWQRVIDVNLTGTFLATKHALVSMLRGDGGAIVTIGSVSAVVAGNTEVGPGYKASKGGVLQLTRLIAAQYGSLGIRANCLCPGPINTGIIGAGDGDDENAAHFAKLGEGVPLGRGGAPSEVASVAVFLASPAASYMTGSAVLADGGFTAL